MLKINVLYVRDMDNFSETNYSACSIVKTLVICCWLSTLTADIYHCFCARENDWGYSNFMALKDMEEKGFIKDDTIVLQAHVKADAPHGIKYVYTCW